MPNTTNTLTATLTATEDTTQNVPINRGTGNPSYDSTSAAFEYYFVLPAGPTTIQLPKNPTTQVYIKNNDNAGKNVVVSWIPSGGVNNNVITLNPGDLILFWCNPAGATNPGITTLTLTP